MLKTRVLANYDSLLERDINDALEELCGFEIVDIKFSVSNTDENNKVVFGALIIYKEKL